MMEDCTTAWGQTAFTESGSPLETVADHEEHITDAAASSGQ
jgi:hypothetical protein